MKCFHVLWIYLVISSTLFSDLKSTNGKVIVDIQNDGVPEATLNTEGLALGSHTPSANLHVKGNTLLENELALGFLNISSDKVLSESEEASVIFVDTSSDNINLTLPPAANVSGHLYWIKKSSHENNLRVKANETIDGLDSEIILTQSGFGLPHLKVISDGANWMVLDKSDDAEQLHSTANLIAWYKFDFTDEDHLKDSSENQLHGVFTNLTVSDNTSVGMIGQSMTFDGNSDYIEMSGSYTRPTTEFTVCFWFLRGEAKQMEIVQDFDWNGGNAYGFLVKCSDSGTVTVFAGDGSGGANANTSDDIEIGVWTHITAIFNNGTSVVYRNGILQSMSDSTNNSSITYVGTSGLKISTSGTVLSVAGKLDDLRIYNEALSENEVRNIFLQGF